MIYLAINIAATGLTRPSALDDPSYPRPVALAGLQWDQNGVSGEYFGYIRQPDVSVSASAEKSHGVSDRIAKSRGLPERTALSWLTNTMRTSTHIIGWDLDFDLDVIRAALVRNGGDPASLIRPGLIKIGLQGICAPIVGKQDDAGAQVPPTMAEACTAIAPDGETLLGSMGARPNALRAIFDALCAKDLIPDLEVAA